MNKRGFGMPQIFAIILVLLIGAIYIIIAFAHARIDRPVVDDETAAQDFGDNRAHYVLMGLLRTPMEKPPVSLDAIIASPTFADFLVHAQREVFAEDNPVASWKTFNAEAKTRMKGTELKFVLFFEGRSVVHTSPAYSGQAWNHYGCPSGTAEVVLPKNHVVRLEIC